MRFLRENSKLVTRLLVNQLGMTIFGFVLITAVMTASKNNPSLQVFVSLFSIIFYLSLIYNVMWEEGSRNAIRIEHGRMERIRAFPLRAAALASLPNFFLALLLIFFYLFGYVGGFAWAQAGYGIVHVVLGMVQAMYVGLFGVLLGLVSDLTLRYLLACGLYVASSVLMILVSMGAYELGMRNIHIFGKRKT